MFIVSTFKEIGYIGSMIETKLPVRPHVALLLKYLYGKEVKINRSSLLIDMITPFLNASFADRATDLPSQNPHVWLKCKLNYTADIAGYIAPENMARVSDVLAKWFWLQTTNMLCLYMNDTAHTATRSIDWYYDLIGMTDDAYARDSFRRHLSRLGVTGKKPAIKIAREKNPRSRKVSFQEAEHFKRLTNFGMSKRAVARMFNVSANTVIAHVNKPILS